MRDMNSISNIKRFFISNDKMQILLGIDQDIAKTTYFKVICMKIGDPTVRMYIICVYADESQSRVL